MKPGLKAILYTLCLICFGFILGRSVPNKSDNPPKSNIAADSTSREHQTSTMSRPEAKTLIAHAGGGDWRMDLFQFFGGSK